MLSLDIFGNESDAVQQGPLWIDASVPESDAANVVPQFSPYGDYVMSTTVTASWHGFSDNLSGIETYYFSWSDGSGTTNALSTVQTQASLSGGVADTTNTLYAWARDKAGNIGAAASVAIRMLSPEVDTDQDGLTNLQEQQAGTDAVDAGKYFLLQQSIPNEVDGQVYLRWPYVDDRDYVLYRKEGSLTIGVWTTLSNPVFTVTNDWAEWCDTNALPPIGVTLYYRVRVSVP